MKGIEYLEKIYIDFASKVSFFEFIQDEFKKADIPLESMMKELSILEDKYDWNIDELSDYVKNYPRSFIIFQNIFQLRRFTNAQLIHFVFNIGTLNSISVNSVYEYMIFNLKHDVELRRIFFKCLDCELDYDKFINNLDSYDKKYLIAIFKFSISDYTKNVSRNFDILESRIKKPEFSDFSIRFSNYLLDNLKLNDMLTSINMKKFLENKRIPRDTKGIHGKYPKIKILEILERVGFRNIDNLLDKNDIKILKKNLNEQIEFNESRDKRFFCTERYVDGIIKPADNKLKRFDLVIFSGNTAKYLFEINFYSTTGTKIGINQNEYLDLNSYIKQNHPDKKFYWITDGNYWLTTDGKSRYINLLPKFEKIFNINTFSENLDLFI